MKRLLTVAMALLMALSMCSCALAEDVSLTVWVGSNDDLPWIEKIIEGFKAANPDNNFTITPGVVGEGDARATVMTDIEAAADVFTYAHDQTAELVAAGALQEVLMNADAVIEANGGKDAQVVKSCMVNDKLYAYPATADNGYFMYYNKEYFTEDDVKSLDAMLAKAAEAGKYVSLDFSSGWYLYGYFAGAGLNVTLNEDGVTNATNFAATDTPITGAQVTEALLAITKNPGFINQNDAAFQTGVKDGTVIAGINGVWNANTVKEAWGDNYACAKLPTYTVAGNQYQMSSFTGGKLVGVNPYSDNVEWALMLAEWLTNEENQLMRFEALGDGPTNVNLMNNESVLANKAIAALAAQSAYGVPQVVGGNFWSPVNTLGQTAIDGNPDGTDIQALLDACVAGILAK